MHLHEAGGEDGSVLVRVVHGDHVAPVHGDHVVPPVVQGLK